MSDEEGPVKRRLTAVAAAGRARAKAIKKVAGRGARALKRHAKRGRRKVMDAASSRKRKATTFAKGVVAKGRNEVMGGVEVVVEGVIDKTLDYTKGTVKHMMKDDDMPVWVTTGIDDFVDHSWPRVKEMVKNTVMTGIYKTVPHEIGEPPRCCPNFLRASRAWLLYHLYPNDKSLWGSFRDPVWWILNLIALVPIYGVTQGFFFVLFLLIDKTDEYQLINFIVRFKGFQFLTGGILMAVISSVQWYICASNGNCDTFAPKDFLWLYPVFCAQIVCIWLACTLLLCSRKKSAPTIVARGFYQRKFDLDGDGALDPDEQLVMRDHQRRFGRSLRHFDELPAAASTPCCCCSVYKHRGGLIRYWVGYDAVVFLVSVGIALAPTLSGPYALTHNSVIGNVGLEKAIFYTKMFYFLFSFPWVFFNIPLVERMLTRSTPSAYNRNGETVPVEPRPYTGWREGRESDTSEDEEEAQAVSSKIMTMFRKLRRRQPLADEEGLEASDSAAICTNQDSEESGTDDSATDAE